MCVSETVTGWYCMQEGRWAWGFVFGWEDVFQEKNNTQMSEPNKQHEWVV